MPQSRETLDSPRLGGLAKVNTGLQIQVHTQPPQFGQFIFCSAPRWVSQTVLALCLDGHGAACGLWKPLTSVPSLVLTCLTCTLISRVIYHLPSWWLIFSVLPPSSFVFFFLIRFHSGQCSSHRRKTKGTFITSQVWDANVVHFSEPLVSNRTLQRQISKGARCLVNCSNTCESALSSCMA